ncbi:MAG: hypothetical protein COT81_02400 [Candidatus Buchananbacteria bacterium CG10_big_fil_rev_8_21_14_0_10_42_9]|uniref:Thioredoxin domain-containing protein n=1 Tax=Candidatus Buchananbacteria bacterium CG10_big_fil_rev_8_21_14_0_10_42_9 TaxID=1974526 RepID=A0A2H0W1E2_9BACT|nr:MAG: hypothetical protein COT81_02400 [Candidatus Buchananbacteria bacterium CG10_big_fil_rev_8_21_14_0_10_42_9]
MVDNNFTTFEQPRKKNRRWYRNCFVLAPAIFLGAFVVLYASALLVGKFAANSNNLEPNNIVNGHGGQTVLNNLPQTLSPPSSPAVSQATPRFKGNPEAKVVIEEYSDFECPFCQQAAPILKKVVEKFGDKIQFIYKDFPLINIHSNALVAALAGRCAFEQAQFWEFHDLMFADQSKLSATDLKRGAFQLGLDSFQFNECLDSNKYFDDVNAEFEEGISRGVKATPTFFINGQKFEGVILEKQLTQIIESLL